MSTTDCRLRRVYESVRTYFFPRQIDVPDQVRDLLGRIYPTVEWDRVGFYCGWPHVLRRGGFHAITLPDPHSVDRINIYFAPDAWQPDERRGLATIVHEGYHVLQIQQMAGGYGLGLARPFLAAYLGEWAGNGFRYADHPMEDEAYHVAGRPSGLFEHHLPGPPGRGWGSVDTPAALVQERVGTTFRQHMAESRPGGGAAGEAGTAAAFSTIASAAWALLWFLVAGVLAAAFLLVDAAGLVVTGLLWVVMQIMCGIRPQIGL